MSMNSYTKQLNEKAPFKVKDLTRKGALKSAVGS